MATQLLRLLGLSALSGALAACTATPPRWEPANLTTITEAIPTELVLQGAGSLTTQELDALQAFQRQRRAAPGERLLLAYPPARRDAALAAADWLAARGATVALRADPLLPRDSLHLGLWQTRVVIPDCGTWTDGNRSDFNNQPWPDFGCASLRNTALMVADPADLSHPGGLGPGSGEIAAGAIERHRTFHDEASSASPISINLGGSGGNSGGSSQ